MARLRFTNRVRVCCNVVLPVEFFSSNRQLCLNCLCHSRGKAQSGWLFLGGLLSSMARLRFTNRVRVCCNVVLPVEFFSSNRQLCLNCLCHSRGQAHLAGRVLFIEPSTVS